MGANQLYKPRQFNVYFIKYKSNIAQSTVIFMVPFSYRIKDRGREPFIKSILSIIKLLWPAIRKIRSSNQNEDLDILHTTQEYLVLSYT